MNVIVRTIKEYKNSTIHTTQSFWEWCETKRKAIKFKPLYIISIQHGNDDPYTIITRNHIFSTLNKSKIKHAVYSDGYQYISLLIKNESDAALLKLML